MTKIISYFINHPKVTNLILLLIIIMGVTSAMQTKRQAYPSVDFNIMKITTVYAGASPEDVEVNVTDPIEDELMDVEDVEKITSLSMENISLIYVFIDPNAGDVSKTKNDIRNAVDRANDLPEEVDEDPEIEELRSTNAPILELGITGNVSEKDLRKYAKDLEDELRGTPGIGLIEKVGYRKREVHINADHKKLDEKYVSLGEVMDAIRKRNVRTSGGSLESYVTEKKIVTFAEYEEPMDVKDVIIRSTFAGQQVRISDVAFVEDTFEEEDVLNKSNGERSISIVIRPQEKADVIDLATIVKDKVKVFEKRLPKSVKIHLLYDWSDYTSALLDLVRNNGLIGFILVIIVMFFFLDWKSAFWTAFGIPISICGAFILFEPFGVTINFITLCIMVILLGMLVDDAIVVAENVYRMKEEGVEEKKATIFGTRQVFWAVTAAVLTTMLAFLPMSFMKGITGKFIKEIPIVVILTLAFSLIESTIFLPSHIAHSKPPKEPPKRTRWIRIAMQHYENVIEWSLHHRAKVLSCFVALAIVIIGVSSFCLKFVLFPQQNPDLFSVIIELPKGVPLHKTEKKIREVEEVIDRVIPKDSLQSYVTRIGHHDVDVYGGSAGQYENWAVVNVNLLPSFRRTRKAEPMIEALEEEFKKLGGYERLTVEPLDDGPPVGKPITVIYTSDDDKLRNEFEKDTIDYLKTINGVYAIETSNIEGKDELRLKLDYDEMARIGISALDVAGILRAAFDGKVVTSIRRGGEEIDFRVLIKDRKKYREEDVIDLSIANKEGRLVALKKFASFEENVGPAVIEHYDGRRSVEITAEVDTNIITAMQANEMLREKFEGKAFKYPGFKMEFGGEEKKTKESMESFYSAFIMAMIAIYFLLVVLFNSFTQPILIMTSIPFAIFGVMLTLMIHGQPLGFMAMIGTLGLIGVVVNDSIVMITHLNEKMKEEQSLGNIVKGAVTRFRPVILTSLTTVAGLLPTAYGIGGDMPFIVPMVLALAWGLVFATIITLILLPILYSFHAKMKS